MKFWKNEWFYHGTCSYSTFNQTQYFDFANIIWKGLQVFDILQAHGISPTHPPSNLELFFENALKTHLDGVTKLTVALTITIVLLVPDIS